MRITITTKSTTAEQVATTTDCGMNTALRTNDPLLETIKPSLTFFH